MNEAVPESTEKLTNNLKLNEKLSMLPEHPGIYRFLSDTAQVIYVGKAKNLKNRVRSYFLSSNQLDPRIFHLVPRINDVEWIITHTESEALILEDQLIKTHKPRFNIQLRDDKSYPYFKLSVQEMFPRLSLVREIKRDGAKYFGPYVAVSRVRETMKIINRYFPLRQSKMPLDGTKTFKPCLNFHLKKCLAPCAGNIGENNYRKIVDNVLNLLRGNYEDLIRQLEVEMQEKATDLLFEDAAKIRDRIKAVKHTLQKQRVVSKQKKDRDVFALHREGSFAVVQVLFVRNGLLLSDDSFFYKNADVFDDQELMRSALSKLYVSGAKPLPHEILLGIEYEQATMLEAYFTERRETIVKVITPQRGEKKAMIAMADKNARQSLKLYKESIESDDIVLDAVQRHLKLSRRPIRVECFDISNISGTNNVASMVCWQDNKPLKKAYRKFKIKSFDGANDFAAMEEVLNRRYKRVKEEELEKPDLIIIDGGKGQLSSAMKILTEMEFDLSETDVIGLAKGRSEKKIGLDKGEEDYEYVVKPGRKNEIRLKKNSAPLYFLQNIRDEAHRFAISFHRNLRRKTSVQSELEKIPGIGPEKRKKLLKSLGSLANIRKKTSQELAEIKGISQRDAEMISAFFQSR